ncbi:DegV family protein [Fervidibacillus albus]|uniref:DegV family protein n=1 Tax=Fervidibacillus albus TaxID=2980026 RepID=A0A9E8RWT1_9BACI|nr:DegV family protein [Fervidibacillus albus]WAA11011.1 DegV family protein [Fervidibacillus albus]
MGKIKITCDRTADLSEEQMKTWDIDTMPLYIHLDGKSYKDRIDIQPEDIYEFAERTGKLPKTAAASIQEYVDFFKQFTDRYDALIHINLGSDFSSTHLNAKLAAEQFTNVYVIDSMNLSTGTGHLVLEACIFREKGLDAEEIVERVKAIVPKVETSFVIDTLDYLKMGGRCSAMTAFSANLLNIKPNIEVINGKMDVGKKYRGKIEKSIDKYVVDRLKGRDDIRLDRIFITHSGIAPEIIERVRERIKQFQNFSEIIETRASCTISSHCGPNTLGILFIRK